MNKNKNRIGIFVILHAALLISSISGVFSKMAATRDTFTGMLLWYAGVIFIMGVYALIWQQILKRLPLTVAYANKPVSLIWGMIWGSLIFGEKITLKMIAGAAIIFVGIWMVVTADDEI